MVFKKEKSPQIQPPRSNTKFTDKNSQENQGIFVKTVNPFEKLLFPVLEDSKSKKTLEKKNLWLPVIIVLFICSSIFLNSFLKTNLDPLVVGTVSSVKSFVSDNLNKSNKPYVVTVGEFGNFSLAMEEAKRLLPELKQINIKELDSGIFTFEIEKLSSKKEAYLLANALVKDNLELVHVRYLPKS